MRDWVAQYDEITLLLEQELHHQRNELEMVDMLPIGAAGIGVQGGLGVSWAFGAAPRPRSSRPTT